MAMASGMIGSGQVDDGQGGNDDMPAPLENLFTLPFALHLKPLPHISYLAEQDTSNASSDQDDEAGASDASSANSNYKAGTHRLHPHTVPVPTHSLKMISMLSQRTGCLDAIPDWAKLVEMLESADDDPHFSKLRAFFDARFDTSGRKQGRRRSKGSSSRSPTRFDDEVRRPSIVSEALKRRKSSKRIEEIDFGGGNSHDTATQSKPRQPEIIVVGKDGAETRTVRFKIRLDLHSIGLAPPPPVPPILARKSTRSTISKRLASSPPKASEYLEVQRVLSNASSNHSHAESLSLYPVGSPDSFRSHPISEDSDERHNGTNGSPIATSRAKEKKTSRTMTNSSAALTSVTSEFGTSPDSRKAGSIAGKLGSFSKNGESGRRPSMIQRLMDFRNLRSNSSRNSNRSASNMSSQSMDEIPKPLNLSGMPSDIAQPTVASPTSDVNVFNSSGFSSYDLGRRRSRTVHSDISNEEAIDLVDDEGSISSSQPHSSLNKRRASSSANPTSLLGFRPAPDMGPVQEGAVFSAYPIHSDDDEVESSNDWGREESDNFLNLWRKAANTSLTLRHNFRPTIASPARTPKGSISTGLNSGAQTPPGSIEWEEQEHMESLLAPFRPESEGDSWWLSGSVDPLPISIACALSEGLGWNGIMELCYGRGSRSERSGAYQPLGRAAEMDRKQEADNNRVKNWAQSVAGVEQSTEEYAAAREKLASLSLANQANSDALGPSESASVKGGNTNQNNLTKIGNWLRKRSTHDENINESEEQENKDLPTEPESRSWKDWADLLKSISNWLIEYETTRVRNGLAGEFGHDVRQVKDYSHTDSGFVEESNFDMGKTRYATRASYQVPRCIIKDALNKQNGFKRRHGIPEGLPVGPDGVELGDYRWARKRLGRNHFATSTVLAANSMAYCLEQIADSDWPQTSAWELDYLEMCVFQSPIVSQRFPSPGSRIVSSNQTFQPEEEDEESRKRAMPCPLPSSDGVWSSSAWRTWLSQVQKGNIIVPAISWQAWWTLIAVLNGGDGSNRTLDVQLKAEEEPFSALDDLEAVYL